MFKFQGSYNNGRPTINGKRVSLLTWYGFAWGLFGAMIALAIGMSVLFYLGFQKLGHHLGVSGPMIMIIVMIVVMIVFGRIKINGRSYSLMPDNKLVRVVAKTITVVAVVTGLFSILF